MTFEEQYEDVLQNIEFSIVNIYRLHPELTDYDVATVLETLTRRYQAEQQDRPWQPPTLSELQQRLYASVETMCELRLGRESLGKPEGGGESITLRTISHEEIVACLKRLRKSVRTWNKEGGRQGYLNFVQGFIL